MRASNAPYGRSPTPVKPRREPLADDVSGAVFANDEGVCVPAPLLLQRLETRTQIDTQLGPTITIPASPPSPILSIHASLLLPPTSAFISQLQAVPSPHLKYPLLLLLPFFSLSSLELSLLPLLTSLPAIPSVSYHILLFLSPFSHLSPRTSLHIWMVGTRLGDAISEKPCTDEGIHCCFALSRIHEDRNSQYALHKYG